MIAAEVNQRYSHICEHIFQKRFKEALEETGQLLRFVPSSDYYYQLENLTENYKTLLHYAFEGYKDPQQENILDNLSASLLGIADEIRQILLLPFLPARRSEKINLARKLGEDPVTTTAMIDDIFFSRALNRLFEESDVRKSGTETSTSVTVSQIDSIFRWLWISTKFTEHHISLVKKIGSSESVEWHDKCLVVSAITLSLLNVFDVQKFHLLIEFCESRQDQVYQRALTGLVLALLIYDKRIRYYPELSQRLKEIGNDETISSDIELILFQLLMAKETEKINREFEEEVLPEMKKMMPRIEDKLQLNQPDEEDMEEKNPGWKDLVEEVPGLFEKIEKFSKMQIEGADVFMSTFQLLKRFDFFNVMSNWFVPFYEGHPEISRSDESDEITSRLIGSLSKAFYICNSDKYSFALNFQAIPAQQRSLIVTNFEAEFAQMQEMASEEQLLDQSLQSNAIFTQYIQDIYRFFRLYGSKDEFDDPFQHRFRFSELTFYKPMIRKEGFTERLAAFYFEKEHYHEAIEMYHHLAAVAAPRGDYYEKIAYGWQKLGRFKKAVEYYQKAELFDTDRLWILNKLGFCSMKLKDYQAALGYFRDALLLQPDDLKLQSQIGQCYLNLKDFEQALQVYNKVVFFSPGSLKVLRPIAYCQFVLGKLAQAESSYTEIFEAADTASPYDLMNAGHVQLCLGNRAKAAGFYKQCLSSSLTGKEEILSAFDEDILYLVKNGIKPEEIPLIKDYLLFQSDPL
ncbi:MAG: tetratricopeptide repeat protein [bacterium]